MHSRSTIMIDWKNFNMATGKCTRKPIMVETGRRCTSNSLLDSGAGDEIVPVIASRDGHRLLHDRLKRYKGNTVKT